MRLLGGIGLVLLGLIIMIYGARNVTSQRGGVITRIFSSADKPMGTFANKLMSWVLGLLLIGCGISLLAGDFHS
jgi:hypothetical protein